MEHVNLKPLVDSCKYGDLNFVKEILDQLENNEIKISLTKENYQTFFMEACQQGHLEIAQYLLTHNTIRNCIDYTQLERAFLEASSKGRINVVKYLLNDPIFDKHPDINADDAKSLVLTATHGYLNVIDYVLTNDEVNQKLSLDNLNRILCAATDYNQVEIMKYLISSPKLNEHADVFYKNHYCLKRAINFEHQDALKYITNFYTKQILEHFLATSLYYLEDNDGLKFLQNHLNHLIELETLQEIPTIQKKSNLNKL